MTPPQNGTTQGKSAQAPAPADGSAHPVRGHASIHRQHHVEHGSDVRAAQCGHYRSADISGVCGRLPADRRKVCGARRGLAWIGPQTLLVALLVIATLSVRVHARMNDLPPEDARSVADIDSRLNFLYRLCAVNPVCSQRFYLGELRKYMMEAAVHSIQYAGTEDGGREEVEIAEMESTVIEPRCSADFAMMPVSILDTESVDTLQFRQFKELFVNFQLSSSWPFHETMRSIPINNCTAYFWVGVMNLVPMHCGANEQWSSTHGRCYCPPNTHCISAVDTLHASTDLATMRIIIVITVISLIAVGLYVLVTNSSTSTAVCTAFSNLSAQVTSALALDPTPPTGSSRNGQVCTLSLPENIVGGSVNKVQNECEDNLNDIHDTAFEMGLESLYDAQNN